MAASVRSLSRLRADRILIAKIAVAASPATIQNTRFSSPNPIDRATNAANTPTNPPPPKVPRSDSAEKGPGTQSSLTSAAATGADCPHRALNASTRSEQSGSSALGPAPGSYGADRYRVDVHRARPDHVSEVKPGEVVVFRSGQRQRHSYSGDEQLAELLGMLRDEGLPFFEVAYGWPPGAVFAELRERGLIDGQYDSVSWRAPGESWIVSGR